MRRLRDRWAIRRRYGFCHELEAAAALMTEAAPVAFSAGVGVVYGGGQLVAVAVFPRRYIGRLATAGDIVEGVTL